MAILIFRRPMHARSALPYAEWLAELGEPLFLFTTSRDADEGRYAHVEHFASFDADGLTELRALDLAKKVHFTRVFAQSEHDLIRAAELRESLGLPGQSLESALAFRDKVRMKIRARAGGIATPEFAALDRPLDLIRFAARNGYPCVVKPRSGAGARGVVILRSEDDLRQFLQQPLPAQFMVETFDGAPLYHVDGVAEENELLFGSVTRYFGTCVSYQQGGSCGGVLLHHDRPLARRLLELTTVLLRAMPPTPHLVFHAEFFAGENGDARLCEIAARPGGSRSTDPASLVYGIDFCEQWVRRSFGLPVALPEPRPWFAAGSLLVPPRRAWLRFAPESVPFDWVADYRLNATIGQRCDEPGFSGANVASFLVTGDDTEQVQSRIETLDAWFREQLQWDEHALAVSG